MATIERYVIANEQGIEEDYEYDTYQDALDATLSSSEPVAIIERVYTYDDSSLVWTSNGEDFWPPDAESERVYIK